MQSIKYHSQKSVLIDYEVAGLGERIGAFLLDFILIATWYILLFMYNTEIMMLPEWANIILVLPPLLYHLVCEIFMNGQSMGKRLLRLKVVRLDGTQPAIRNYLFRWVLRPLDLWLYGSVAIITILINGKGQRLGDLAAGTTLVKYNRQHHELEQLLYRAEQEEVYQVVFKEASQLTAQEVEQIRQTLRTYRLTAKTQPVQELAAAIQARLAIDTNMPPVRLLGTLVKDYEQMSGRV